MKKNVIKLKLVIIESDENNAEEIENIELLQFSSRFFLYYFLIDVSIINSY